MRCDAHFIMNQPSLNFALYSKGTTERAVSIRVEKLLMEHMPKRSGDEMDEIIAQNRKRYSAEEVPTTPPPRSQKSPAPQGDDDIESLNKA
jgi:hypothetical protein